MQMSKSTPVCQAITLSVSVQAQTVLEQRFAELDSDHNGEISWHEAYGVRAMEFISPDNNFDGLFKKIEFLGRTLPFSRVDADAVAKL